MAYGGTHLDGLSEEVPFLERMEHTQIDWERRCRNLEGQLAKFKTQAKRIRDAVGQKVNISSDTSSDAFHIQHVIFHI